MALPPDEQLLASAVRFLIDGHEEDAASVLLSCSLSARETSSNWWEDGREITEVVVTLAGPRMAYDALEAEGVGVGVHRAIAAVLPSHSSLRRIITRAELVEVDQGWREELLEIARGRGVHNQGVALDSTRPLEIITWVNLRFRSQSEKRIAQALDSIGVLFLPNCKARLNMGDGRANREADFLICDKGRWGILEVDGEPFHPPSRTAQDHERDRMFQQHGVRLVQHYDANQCYNDPHAVVKEFLTLLSRL
jgi:hypothetical protein